MGSNQYGNTNPKEYLEHVHLIVLWENLAENRVHHAKHNGVGHGLDQQGLTRGEGQKHARGEENEENRGHNDVEIDHL